MNERYESAKERYGELGVDVEAALDRLKDVPVSVHCWQGDDVIGLEGSGRALSGGIQTTGNYPGRARNFEELKSDFLEAMSLVPGRKKISLHASYAVFQDGERVDRDQLEPRHFDKWIEFAEENGLGIDFNPTYFSHPMVRDNLTLSSPDEEVRRFWVRHGVRSREISAYIAERLGQPVVCNQWIPDGCKDIPADRMGPRDRFRRSLDEIFAQPYENVIDCIESKVFGIGLEAYTVGSAEFCLSYAASHPGVYPLLDNGHYHPTEVVSDKIPSLLLFFDKVPLHVTRSVRWDSDHVVLFEDELKEIMKEVVRNNALDRVLIGLDYFDASINRVAAWTVGARNVQKALLYAMLQPWNEMKRLQDENRFTELMVMNEELKTLPFGDIWEHYCTSQGVPASKVWLDEVKRYEKDVLSKRN